MVQHLSSHFDSGSSNTEESADTDKRPPIRLSAPSLTKTVTLLKIGKGDKNLQFVHLMFCSKLHFKYAKLWDKYMKNCIR
jgi:hypothetical protein